jgi:YD repeat-containing protein
MPTYGPPNVNEEPSIDAGTELPSAPNTGAVAAQPQISQGQPPQQSQAAPQAAPDKHSAFGRLARSLFTGTDTSYQYDDQGKLVETQTKQKPGQLFRHMLAGALLGGAIGAEDPTHTFAGGLVRGGAGVQKDDEKKDELRRQQAKEAYEMRLKGIQSGREGEKLGMEKEKLDLEKREQSNKDMLAGAQTSMYNSEVLRNNVLSQGASLDQHIKTKQFFAPEKATFEAMGLDPVLKNISESEMHNTWSKRPDAGGLTWLVTDVKMGADDKGMPTYEYIYSGYDLKKDVAISAETLKLWKASGMDKTHPEIFQYKPGSMIPANNYKAWNQQALSDMNQKLELSKAGTDIEFKQQQIKESQARAARDWADSVKQNKDLRKEQRFEDAMNDLATNGYDISKVKPENRGLVGQYAGQMLRDLGPSYTAATKIGETTGDWSPAHKIGQQMDEFRTLMAGTVKGEVDTSKLPKPVGKDVSVAGPAGRSAYVQYKAAFGDVDKALAAMVKDGWSLEAAAEAAPAGPETVGGAIKSGVKSAAGTVVKYHPIAIGKRILEMPASDITNPEKIKEAIVK